MKIEISGAGALVPASPVPDAILALAYPYFTIEDAPDGGLWLTLSPYPEVYDEEGIRSFLRALNPYIRSGRIDCGLRALSGTDAVVPEIHWAYYFLGGSLSRNVYADAKGPCLSAEYIAI